VCVCVCRVGGCAHMCVCVYMCLCVRACVYVRARARTHLSVLTPKCKVYGILGFCSMIHVARF